MATPLAAFSIRLRARIPNQPGVLGQLATAIGAAGGSLVGIEIVATDGATVTRDVVVFCGSEGESADVAMAARAVEGIEILDVEDRTFALHERGKLTIDTKRPLRDRDDLAMAYTPGVARVCMAIADDRAQVHRYTMKANTVAVVTDGTAVLGLGDIGPEAALPVMEGKAVLFKEFADVDAFPICLATKDEDEIVRTVEAIAPVFGGINLEDISAPRCFSIEARLRESLDIPVFHDDQHGTAIVVLAALLNALRVVDKRIEDVRVVTTGCGAAGMAVTRTLQHAGVRWIVGCDEGGALYRGRAGLNPAKQEYA